MKLRNTEKILWITVAVICPLLPVSLYFAGNWYSILHNYSIGMVFGITSFVYFFVVLLISSRIRYLDSVFGHDRVLSFHGYMALAAISTALLHILFKLNYNAPLSLQTYLGISGFCLFVLIIGLALLLMSGLFSSRFKVIDRLRKLAVNRYKLNYSRMKIFHNFSLIAFVLISIHILLSSSTQENLVRGLLFGICASIGLLAYVYHKFIRAAVFDVRLTVNDLKCLTPGIVEICMKCNDHKGRLLKHKAGQFCYFRINSEAISKEEHPFTISSRPEADKLVITVKDLGDYTSALKNVSVGSEVICNGPYGVFTPVQNGNSHVFVAGGIGITPFLSIISDWNFQGIKDHITLVWSTKSDQEMICRDFFETVEMNNRNFHFVPIISRPENDFKGKRHIDSDLIVSLLDKSELKKTFVYICGPESLRSGVKKMLMDAGFHSGNIHYEKFSL